MFYQADIIIERIRKAADLVKILSERSLPEAQWHSLGAMIAKFHLAGIYHADLNAHNILLDNDEQPWLIDFDKCEQRLAANDWQQANLDRLHRSFNKEKGLDSKFEFEAKNWQWLLEGYKSFYHLPADSRH